jgi:prepilin-type N-terminal cleavage/methylation domain-containing protein
MYNNKSGNEGFTLIELLIVVAIIAILAAIALPNFLEAQVRAKVSRAASDMRSMAVALESYAVDHNAYAPDGDDIQGSNPIVDFDVATRLKVLTTPISYIATLPTDPFNLTKPTGLNPLDPHNFFFTGAPPYTYAYTTFGAYQFDPLQNQPANNGKPNNYTLSSLGPTQRFDSAAPAQRVVYDPTNGTVSAGDIFYSGGTRVD